MVRLPALGKGGYRNSIGTGTHRIQQRIHARHRTVSWGDFASELARTRRLLEGARKHGVPVFHTTIAHADPQRGFRLLRQEGSVAYPLQTRN
jgi:hypothetical protein